MRAYGRILSAKRRWGIFSLKGNKRARVVSFFFVALGSLMIAMGISLFVRQTEGAGSAHVRPGDLVAAGCHQAQALEYVRCGHEVLRRLPVPPEWVGKTKDGVLERLEEQYRLTAFSPSLIEISSRLELFCPQHFVLMLDGEGGLSVFRNTYGFGMDKITELRMPRVDETLREKFVRGLPFDSREALDEFVSGIDEDLGALPPASSIGFGTRLFHKACYAFAKPVRASL